MLPPFSVILCTYIMVSTKLAQSAEPQYPSNSRSRSLGGRCLTLLDQLEGAWYLSSDVHEREVFREMNATKKSSNMLHGMISGINSYFRNNNYMSWNGSMQGQEANVKIAAAWWTSKPSGLPLTVLTGSTIARLHQLNAQCLTWKGPVSVVLYLPLTATGHGGVASAHRAALQDHVLQVTEMLLHQQREVEACRMDILLVYELHADEQSATLLYPFNVVRNLARLQCTAVRQVLLIPCFDTNGTSLHDKIVWADALATGPKEMMTHALDLRIAFTVAEEVWPIGHRMQDTQRWMTADEDYVVKYEEGAEPFIIGDRLRLPWFDERYRGYGRDKISYLQDLATRGYTFTVLHDAFSIHRAHPHSRASDVYMSNWSEHQSQLGLALREYTEDLFHQQLELEKQGQPWTPAINAATLAATQQLSWWRGVDTSQLPQLEE